MHRQYEMVGDQGRRTARGYGRFGFGADRRWDVPRLRMYPFGTRGPGRVAVDANPRTLFRAPRYAIRRISFLIERVPPTCPASTPDPVTAWMAVAGSGVSPRQATFEAPALPANRRSRRPPPGRTRDSTPLSENYTPIPSPVPAPARLREATPRTSLVRAAAGRRTGSLQRSDRPLLRPKFPVGRELDCPPLLGFGGVGGGWVVTTSGLPRSRRARVPGLGWVWVRRAC
jgi:hypothetical protein